MEYTFVFPGTKEDFLNSLNRFNHNTSYSGDTFYYFEDYIVKLVGDEIHFGVARGGHSGGYWFIPTITDLGDRMEFRGTIRYIGPKDNRGTFGKAIDRAGEFLLFVLILPIVLLFKLYTLVERVVRAISNRPKQKEKTEEERLFDLMEKHLGCIVIGDCVEQRGDSVFPTELDGAKVLFYTPQGDYGAMEYPNGEVADDYHYLAICKYLEDNNYYLFCCNENYEVVNDWMESSIADCMKAAASSYKENIVWYKTDRD